MAEPPEQHHEDPEIGYLEDLRALGPLFRPLSEAEMAKRKRMTEEAGYLDPVQIKFIIIMMQEGLT